MANAVDGLAQFMITFDFRKPVMEASQDVRDAISQIRGDLPQEMEEPIITRFDWGAQPILSLTLSSPTLDAKTLTSIADPGVVGAFRSVAGVAQATVVGGNYPEMTVQLRPAAMQAAGVGIDDVVRAVGAQNLAAPVGRLNGAQEERAIRLQGKLTDAAAFRQLVVTQHGGTIVRLGDVADVNEGTEEQRTAATYNGKAAVGIDVKKAKGASTASVVDMLKAQVTRISATLPADAKLEIVRDAGERVKASVDHGKSTLIIGALLTVLVVFLFLNSWRSTVITGLALPVSVLAGFVGVWAFGFTLNMMSLLGLSLRDRRADRRRDRGPREHRAPRAHGEGSLHRGAGGHGADRAGGRGDDVLDHCGVRPDCNHDGTIGAVAQAVCAVDRRRRAGVALRLVLARPDALGLLAGPGPQGEREVVDHPTARQVRSRVPPVHGMVCPGHRLGARSPDRNGWPCGP